MGQGFQIGIIAPFNNRFIQSLLLVMTRRVINISLMGRKGRAYGHIFGIQVRHRRFYSTLEMKRSKAREVYSVNPGQLARKGETSLKTRKIKFRKLPGSVVALEGDKPFFTQQRRINKCRGMGKTRFKI